MTSDITKNLSDSEKLDFIVNAVSDLNRRMSTLEERQTTLETLVHDRLHDTRPIWQAVLEQMQTQQAQLQTLQEQMQAQQAQLQMLQEQLQRQQEQLQAQQAQLDRLELGQRRIEQKLQLLHQDNLEMRTDLAILTKRVDALEKLQQAA